MKRYLSHEHTGHLIQEQMGLFLIPTGVWLDTYKTVLLWTKNITNRFQQLKNNFTQIRNVTLAANWNTFT